MCCIGDDILFPISYRTLILIILKSIIKDNTTLTREDIYFRLRNREDPEQTSCPAAMIAILSPRRSASSMLCVVMIIVLPA